MRRARIAAGAVLALAGCGGGPADDGGPRRGGGVGDAAPAVTTPAAVPDVDDPLVTLPVGVSAVVGLRPARLAASGLLPLLDDGPLAAVRHAVAARGAACPGEPAAGCAALVVGGGGDVGGPRPADPRWDLWLAGDADAALAAAGIAWPAAAAPRPARLAVAVATEGGLAVRLRLRYPDEAAAIDVTTRLRRSLGAGMNAGMGLYLAGVDVTRRGATVAVDATYDLATTHLLVRALAPWIR